MRKLYEIVKILWIQKRIVVAATIWGNTVYEKKKRAKFLNVFILNSKLFATLTNDLGFLGWPATSDAHYLSDFEEATRQIRVGDEVVFVDFFQNASKMVVMLKKHKHFEEPIMEVLMTEFEKQDKIQIKDIEANQVVACQWSEDEGYYRAVVKKVGHISQLFEILSEKSNFIT